MAELHIVVAVTRMTRSVASVSRRTAFTEIIAEHFDRHRFTAQVGPLTRNRLTRRCSEPRTVDALTFS